MFPMNPPLPEEDIMGCTGYRGHGVIIKLVAVLDDYSEVEPSPREMHSNWLGETESKGETLCQAVERRGYTLDDVVAVELTTVSGHGGYRRELVWTKEDGFLSPPTQLSSRAFGWRHILA